MSDSLTQEESTHQAENSRLAKEGWTHNSEYAREGDMAEWLATQESSHHAESSPAPYESSTR